MGEWRSGVLLTLALFPIVAPVVGLFFISDLGVLIGYVLGGWVLVGIVTFATVMLVGMYMEPAQGSAERAERRDDKGM